MEGKSKVMKVVILGDSGVGKTALMQQYINGTFQEWYRTLGLDYLTTKVTMGKIPVTIQIWDTSGIEKYADTWSRYYQDADCCILVFSVTDATSFISLEKWKTLFLAKCKPKIPGKFPFVIVGNKTDACLCERQIVPDWKLSDCMSGVGSRKYFYAETSAKHDENVDECFDKIIEQAEKYKQLVLNV